MSLVIGLPRECRPSERRVALDPSRVERLLQSGVQVHIEAECGHTASFHDEDYGNVTVMDNFADVVRHADIVVKVVCPTFDEIALLTPGTILICIMSAFQHTDEVKALRDRSVTVLAMDHLPRTTRAQPLDALSSQATVAGYKAALLAAELSPRLFPMLTTAAGTIRPSRVLVIGAGVAGLQAIATARRLGAQVEAYDIRKAAKEQIESLGARMVDTGVEVEGAGGLARALRKDEKQKQHDVLAKHLARAHVVICAASIPGRRAPRIISEDMVDGMLPESVIVDLAASTGGNCELTRIGEHYYHNETLIVGPLNLPSHGAVHASEMYARNVYNMLKLIISDNEAILNQDDEIIARCIVTHDGQINHGPTAALLEVDHVTFGGAVHSAADMAADMAVESAGWLPDAEDPIAAPDTRASDGDTAEQSGRSTQLMSSSGVTPDPIVESGAHIGGDSKSDPVPGTGTTGTHNPPGASSALKSDGVGGHSGPADSAELAATAEATNERLTSTNERLTGDVSSGADAVEPSVRKQSIEGRLLPDADVPAQSQPGQVKPAAEDDTVNSDDFTLIEGVGPALQERLYAFGYRRLEQLAALDDEQAYKLSIQLELGDEVTRQDWVGQARELLKAREND